MNKKNIGPLKRLAIKETREEIQKQSRKRKRPLTYEEKKQVKEKVLKKMRTRLTIFGTIGLVGIGGFAGFRLGSSSKEIKGITEGKTIEINLDEINKDLDVSVQDTKLTDKEIFINGIKYDISEDQNITTQAQNEMTANVRKEIEALETPEEVRDYIKKIYAEQFNMEHDEKISYKDVSFSKNSNNIVFYDDVAENGDKIQRYCTEAEAEEMNERDGDTPKIRVSVNNEQIHFSEEVGQEYNGEFFTVYEKDEKVEQNEETTLGKVANVVLTGIDRATSMVQEKNTWKEKEEYKNKFVNAVVKYKESKIEKIINSDINNEKQEQQGIEPGD